ncbi:unnamed protein product, partial [Effrenium voratum]
VPSRPLGSGVELESQVVQLRNCLETLERRLEEELRSFLAISDKRLQVREEQLRGVGETLQASADAALEQLGRRVDVRLRELERAGMAPMALDEVWDCIKRLQNDCQDLDSKLRRATSTDEIAERFQEMERAQAQRLEDRLATQERRLSDYRVQLQGSNREFLQAIEHRCEMLEKNFWEGQSDRGDVVEAVFKRLAEAAPIRELHDEKINSSNYDKEVQRSRLAAAEAKLSKFAALESKVDFMESQMSQQLEEQAQQFRNVGELQQRLVQKLSATEASCQRVEAQGSVLQAKLQAQMEEDRDRHSSSFESMQLRLVQRLEEVEGRSSRYATRSEKDLVDNMTALAQKISEDNAAAQRQADKRLHSIEERCDQVVQMARVQMERGVQDLKVEAEATKNALEMDLHRAERFMQEMGSKISSQEAQLLRMSEMDVQRSRLETLESKVNEVQGEQRTLRDVKAIVDAHKLQADRRHGDLEISMTSLEEQLRGREQRRSNDAEAQKKREAEEQMRKEAEEQERREAMEAEEQRKRQEAEEAEEARQAQQKAQEAKQKQLEAARAAAGVVQPKEHTPTSQAGAPKPGFEKRRARVTGLPPTARASARSKEEEIKKVFAAIDTTSSGALTLDDLQSFLCDFLGFGQAEVAAFHQRFGEGDAMSLEGFKKGYASLNPFTLTKRHKELIIRKSGSLSSAGLQALQLEELEDSEVYVCELTNTAYVDVCKRCAILIGPSETSVFVRDCEDCVFWIAAQQLRTRDCKRCSFFLYSKTEPVIESSEDLAFAPWSASYPCSKAHFEKLGFNPEKNLWNAIYDFSGKVGKCNWRILGLEETARLQIELEDPPPKPEPENPAAPLTYEALCAEPLESGESCGTSVGQIPQTRPALPAAPPMDFKEVQQIVVQDGGKLAALEQLVRLRRKDSSSQPSTPGALAMATLAGKTLMKAGGGSAEMEAVAKATPASASSALGMARLAGQTLMEAGGGSAETEAVAKATPASASSALGMARLAGQTLMEAGGGSAETEAVAKATPASASSALGMARLAGQTLMEAGTTVHGTMAVEEEDSSGDSPRPAPSKAPKPAAKPAAKPDAAQVRKLLGESSDEESEEAKPSTAPSASAALPKLSLGKAMPKPAVNRAHPVAVDSEEDDDSDIEEAMKKAAAAASASRTSPLGGSSAAKSAPTSLRLSPQSRAEASVPVVDDEDDDSGNDFDEDIDLPM